MNDVIVDLAITSGILALLAWVCVHTSRPFFGSKLARVISQTGASFLLLISFVISKAMQRPNEVVTDEMFGVIIAFFAVKTVAMYLISCYAKSVGKSPYWSFVGLLNFGLALVVMATSLWRDRKAKDLRRIDE